MRSFVTLDTLNLIRLLEQHGILPGLSRKVRTQRLAGGCVNNVYLVTTSHSSLVVKEVLERTDVASCITLSPDRIVIEYEALKLLAEILPDSFVHPLFLDTTANIYGMEAVPSSARLLESDLLDGVVDLNIAGDLAKICATFHSKTAMRSDLARTFANEEGIVFKLHRQCFDINVMSSMKERIRSSVMKLTSDRFALIHGDLCPKNVFVHNNQVILFDLEEAHFGNPALEIAYIISHYWLIGLIKRFPISLYLSATRSIWLHYREHLRETLIPREEDIVLLIGTFMLSRVDGVARPYWITNDERTYDARQFALALLQNEHWIFSDALDFLST